MIILFGNTTTLVTIARVRSLQTKSNAFLASLAAADIMVGLVLIPYGLWLVPDIRDQFDQAVAMCILIISAGSSAIVVSILNMLMVALDRLIYISHPFLYQRVVTNQVTGVAVILPWAIGLSFGNCQWFIYTPKTSPPQCVANKMLPKSYYKYAATLCYFIPCLAIFIIYIKIAWIARRQGLAIKKMNAVRPFHDNFDPAKMMMTVFGVFFISWTPRFVIHAVPDDVLNTYVPELVYNLAMMLGLLNSGVNFLIYPLHNKQFQRVFKQIFCFWSKSQQWRKQYP
ncbi:unnamed protein product, partial [Lymnaea stagnalis]